MKNWAILLFGIIIFVSTQAQAAGYNSPPPKKASLYMPAADLVQSTNEVKIWNCKIMGQWENWVGEGVQKVRVFANKIEVAARRSTTDLPNLVDEGKPIKMLSQPGQLPIRIDIGGYILRVSGVACADDTGSGI
ncbi:MAG: hypothetical protein AB7F86_08680 [Bdellovibrionales bacterium]